MNAISNFEIYPSYENQEKSEKYVFKGTVRRKPRWVKIGIFPYCLATDILNFYLNGHYCLKSKKPVSAFNYHKN
jgi:hypothetical protein